MQTDTFQTPVVLIVFNRPRQTRAVFDAIAKIHPSKLLVIADGPRANKAGEEALCSQVREIAQSVDWPCDVLTNFAEKNLGCQERIIGGLNWAFSLVEEAIILEDDCLPDLSFFPFCQELLAKYRGDPRVAAISGTSFVERYLKTEYSYFFSMLGGNWGWATWRSEWQRYDRHLTHWPELRQAGTLSELFDQSKAVAYWTRVFDDMHRNPAGSAWDYQWLYTHLVNNALTIVPSVNLVANIGFGPDATHTSEADSRFSLPSKTMKFPLRHPPSLIPMRSMDRRVQDLFTAPLSQRAARKFHRLTGGLFP